MAGEAVSKSADVETSLPIGLGPDMAKKQTPYRATCQQLTDTGIDAREL